LVALEPAVHGSPRADRVAHADELLAHVGIAHRRDSRPSELSGGEQQRVALCAALAHRPRLFLADEPTGELDHANALLIYDAIAVTAAEPTIPDSLVELRGSEPLTPSGAKVAEVCALTRRFAAATALDHVDASFSSGQLAVVTGPSGSGKTTLLHLLAGLDL